MTERQKRKTDKRQRNANIQDRKTESKTVRLHRRKKNRKKGET